MSKSTRTKPQKNHSTSTSIISQPVVENISKISIFSAFSTRGNWFAFLSLAVDKHRLRIYETASGRSIAEDILDSARVTTLCWKNLVLESVPVSNDLTAQPIKKRKKKRDSILEQESRQSTTEVVALGLSDGGVSLFSPSHGRIMQTLSHVSSTSSILAVDVFDNEDGKSTLLTSGADGVLRLWDVQKNDILGSWKNNDHTTYTCLAKRDQDLGNKMEFLGAHYKIQLLSQVTSRPENSSDVLASFAGHASPIKQLCWIKPQTTLFLSMAEADRCLYIWNFAEDSTLEGKPLASITLDADARCFSLIGSSSSDMQTLVTLSATSKISIIPIPSELPSPTTFKSARKVPTLLPCSNIFPSSEDLVSISPVMDVTFAKEGVIRIARLYKGTQPIFKDVCYLDDTGNFLKELVLDYSEVHMNPESKQPIPNKRYIEFSSVSIQNGVELGHDEDMEDMASRNIEGDLEVDLAELSLGQRLAIVSAGKVRPASDSDDEPGSHKVSKRNNHTEVPIVPANSLTRTLIQALHSSDTRLLETCLAHSDATLIRNTVQRLPPQLAVSLVTACVERLGRGARGVSMKGGGAGASSQRGMGLITWVKAVLVIHTGHLMTMPDLVARLSGLHSTLTARLNLHESLLSLSGRLDMVLSQIELRSSVVPAPLTVKKDKARSRPEKKAEAATQYVEGESETSDEDGKMDVDVESDNDDASIEDIELGGSSDEGEYMSEFEDEDENGGVMNGYIDDEAEEASEDDDDDDDDSE